MAHRLLVVRARSQWPTTISSRDSHICPSSPLIRSEYTMNNAACRMFGTSVVGAPRRLPKGMVSEGASFSSASIQMTSNNTKAKSSSPQRSTKPKPKSELVIFHNPASLASAKLLAFLQSAQRAYPETKRRIGPPLDFELTVRERLPTAEELQDMYSLLNESSWTVFRAKNAVGNYRIHPTSARSLLSGIELERQEQLAKAKQKTHDSGAVASQPPATDSPDNAVACDPPATDSPQTEPKNNKVQAINLPVLDINHSLFGTQTFAWPVLVCPHTNQVFAGSRLKNVHRFLLDRANERDKIVVKSKEQIEEEFDQAKQANWTYPTKDVSPDEDDTLKWFNESKGRPVRNLSR